MFCDRRHNAFIASVLNASPSIIVRFSSSGTGHARPVSLRHLTIAGAATPDVSYIGPAYARISASLALATDLAAGVGVRLASAPFGVTVSEVIPADPDARTEERYDDGDTAEAARAQPLCRRQLGFCRNDRERWFAISAICQRSLTQSLQAAAHVLVIRMKDGRKVKLAGRSGGRGWIGPFSSPLVFTETTVAVVSIGGSGIPYAVQVSDTVTKQPS